MKKPAAMISVIVPIYNIEEYLQKCLDSLAEQSFPNVEFLLIDDGSTDQSGKIADKYISDSRFSVFHTANHGLSAARNLGIEKANGDWLMFVDGDDWVTSDFCEEPYRASLNNDADLVIFRWYDEINDKVSIHKSETSTGVINAETAMKCGGGGAWNKLYRKELFEAIRYPVGMVFEDLLVTHRLIYRAKRIVSLPDALYYHVFRKDSISNSRSSKNKRDGFFAANQRAEDMKAFGWSKETYELPLWHHILAFLAKAYPSDDPLFLQAEEAADQIKGIPSKLSWREKIMLLIWKTDKKLFHLVCRALKHKDEQSRPKTNVCNRNCACCGRCKIDLGKTRK